MLEKTFKDTWQVREETEVDYSTYLCSEHWLALRKKLMSRKAHQYCRVCLSTSSLELHHRTYKRIGNGDERDVIAVCRGCHQEIHDWAKKSGRSVRLATKDIIKSTRWKRS